MYKLLTNPQNIHLNIQVYENCLLYSVQYKRLLALTSLLLDVKRALHFPC